MKLGILSRGRHLYSTQRLVEVARKRRHEVRVIDPYECAMSASTEHNDLMYRGRSLERLDCLIPRVGGSAASYARAVLHVLEEGHGVPLVNPIEGILLSHDKFASLQHLAAAELPIPRSVLLRYSEQLDDALEAVGGLPVILKLIRGTQGVGVMKADSLVNLRGMLDVVLNLRPSVILQEYISESGGSDVRVFVVGGRAVAAMRRSASDPDEFRSNLHRGGTGQTVRLTDELEEIAVDAAETFGLGLAGIDILPSDRGPLVIEINSTPGLEGIEEITGRDVARDILCHAEEIV
jgi:ribosomal protein S6--L-glutamate ligase